MYFRRPRPIPCIILGMRSFCVYFTNIVKYLYSLFCNTRKICWNLPILPPGFGHKSLERPRRKLFQSSKRVWVFCSARGLLQSSHVCFCSMFRCVTLVNKNSCHNCLSALFTCRVSLPFCRATRILTLFFKTFAFKKSMQQELTCFYRNFRI